MAIMLLTMYVLYFMYPLNLQHTVESRLFDWFNSNIALNRTKFEVPGQALYTSVEKSLVSYAIDTLYIRMYRVSMVMLRCVAQHRHTCVCVCVCLCVTGIAARRMEFK